MIKIKLEKNRLGEPSFKLGINNIDQDKYIFLKRALMDSKSIKGLYNYLVPLRYFIPIFNNLPKDIIILDKQSILSYLEFSDNFDEKYYYTLVPSAKYMKLWRIENCPNIYRISIDIESLTFDKIIAFKKIELNN